MIPVLQLLGLFWRAHRTAFLRGVGLMLATLAAGGALLGLSGWFITACGIAGAAGVGIGFDFFRPSAGVRFLALVRTAARYGERLTTHDATLRFLATLRVRLFNALALRPFDRLAALNRAAALHRLTGDVDALDAMYLRLFAPVAAGLTTLALAATVLSWLVSPWVALWVVGVLIIGATTALVLGFREGAQPARRRAYALEALRLRFVDLVAGRVELAMAGRLERQRETIAQADARAAAASGDLDRLELLAASLLQLAPIIAAAGALVIGAEQALSPSVIAIGVFAALGLGEVVAPLARGALEAGRMRLAAARVARDLDEPIGAPAASASETAALDRLSFEDVSFAWAADRGAVFEDLNFTVRRGEWAALTGPSGSGKSAALLLGAGLLRPTAGCVKLGDAALDEIPEPLLRAALAMASQRSVLFSGAIADNLRLAAPDAQDEALITALKDVCLWDALLPRGGLQLRLGEGGLGLSGGESRRLALARLLLRNPAVALLDEPTEGLDEATTRKLLDNLRQRLANAAVVTASHRSAEISIADQRITLAKAKILT